jgi:hypothetical protein
VNDFGLGSRSQGKPVADIVEDDEVALAALYGLVAS